MFYDQAGTENTYLQWFNDSYVRKRSYIPRGAAVWDVKSLPQHTSSNFFIDRAGVVKQ